MSKRLEIIETPEYTLVVSDEKVSSMLYDATAGVLINTALLSAVPKGNLIHYVAAHKPKGNAKELDLPLLPEIVVEDDVEKLAYNYFVELNEINKYDDNYQNQSKIIRDFKAGYKAATKIYSEKDLRKAIDMAREESGFSDNTMSYDYDEDEIVKFIKQPKTPKYFIAEMEVVGITDDGVNTIDELKTTKTNGKTYLVGKYSNE
jgi:hypothetical protein